MSEGCELIVARARQDRNDGRLREALTHESLGKLPEAERSWRAARPMYDVLGILAGVHECDEHIARLECA